MSKILVFVEQTDGEPAKASLAALTAAAGLLSAWGASGLAVLALGPGSQKVAAHLGGVGIEALYYSESAAVEKFRAVAYAAAAKAAMSAAGASSFVAAATSTGRDFSPRLAASLDAGQASDIIAVHSDGTLDRPMYAGNVIATVELTGETRIVTVRPTAFDAAVVSGAVDTVSEVTFSVDDALAGEVIGYDKPESARPELSDASVVVSGGRALQSSENFEKYIYPLADALGAAVGASRAAVDSGYAPNDWQVGQTGKVVAPELYIAVGISGAIQHLAGMKDSKVIVAINKDADAPIYEIADYGLVADLYEVIEPLTEKIKAARA